jgi:hypothetical protein
MAPLGDLPQIVGFATLFPISTGSLFIYPRVASVFEKELFDNVIIEFLTSPPSNGDVTRKTPFFPALFF